MAGLPRRTGFDDESWRRRRASLARERETSLQRLADRNDVGGIGVLWSRTAGGFATQRLGIQPGIADDLPSLLSTLAVEIGWPGVPSEAISPRAHPERAVAVWVRVWQVRDAADLEVTLRWDERGDFHAAAVLLPLSSSPRPLAGTTEMITLLDTLAVSPRSSESPHGLLLVGNRAMDAGDAAGARDLYERAITDLPAHPEVHRNLALALARLGEWDRASALMRQAQELTPQDPNLAREYLALETDAGIAAVREGELERGAAHFLRILQHWPDEATALVNLGNIRLREGRSRESRAIFRRFLRLHPRHAVAEEIRLLLQRLE